VLVAPSSRPPAGAAAGFLHLGPAIALVPLKARAHDPSPFRGPFRTWTAADAWFDANPVGFLSGANALAISSVDSNHLLLATDSGVLRSRSAGFALVSYDKFLPQAVEGRSALQRLSLTTLGGVLAWRRLAPYYRTPQDVASFLETVKAS